jgi:hypothetical protein
VSVLEDLSKANSDVRDNFKNVIGKDTIPGASNGNRLLLRHQAQMLTIFKHGENNYFEYVLVKKKFIDKFPSRVAFISETDARSNPNHIIWGNDRHSLPRKDT